MTVGTRNEERGRRDRDSTFKVDPPQSGFANMAADAHLLEAAEGGEMGCRVYSWDGPWISLGKQQLAERDLLDPNLVPWVMRPTGGKAVLHGHDVTVGLALPLAVLAEDGESLSRSVRKVYRRIAAPLVAALNDCGICAALGEDTPFARRGVRSADCFAHVSANDIVDARTGLKVCGCALRLTATAVLVQASIPNGRPLVDPQEVFAIPQSPACMEWEGEGFSEALWARLVEAFALCDA